MYSPLVEQISTLTKGSNLTKAERVNRNVETLEKVRELIKFGHEHPGEVLKSFDPAFVQHTAPGLYKADYTTTTPGQIFQYDLEPLTFLAPIAHVWRDLLDRMKGVGLYHEARIISTSALSTLKGPRPSIGVSEGDLGTYPNNPTNLGDDGLTVAIILKQKFMQAALAATYFSQWAGVGYEDVFGLAALEMNTQFMEGESDMLIGGSAFSLATPVVTLGTPTTAAPGQTPISGLTTNLSVKVAALNYRWNTTAASAAAQVSLADSATSVVGWSVVPVPGAVQYAVYVGTGGSPSAWNFYGYSSGSSGIIQGAIPTTTAAAPIVDSGTAYVNDFEGLLSVLSGTAAANGIYPSGTQAGLLLPNYGSPLNCSGIQDILSQHRRAGWLADADSIITSEPDLAVAGQDLSDSKSPSAARIVITTNEMGGVTGGVIVDAVRNPITRKVVDLKSDPKLPQGTAIVWQDTTTNTLRPAVTAQVVALQAPVLFDLGQIDLNKRALMVAAETLCVRASQFLGLVQGLTIG